MIRLHYQNYVIYKTETEPKYTLRIYISETTKKSQKDFMTAITTYEMRTRYISEESRLLILLQSLLLKILEYILNFLRFQ